MYRIILYYANLECLIMNLDYPMINLVNIYIILFFSTHTLGLSFRLLILSDIPYSHNHLLR